MFKDNNELRKYILDNNLHIEERRLNKLLFDLSRKDDLTDEDLLHYHKLKCLYHSIGSNQLLKECHRLNKNINDRRRTFKEKIDFILYTNKDCYFLTLTFKDSVLNKTTAETRRQYVRKYLKSNYNVYIANIDFGNENGREHYHAVVGQEIGNCRLWEKFGFFHKQKIRCKDDSNVLAKYVVKLTNHAFKETCKKNYCIYSKNT